MLQVEWDITEYQLEEFNRKFNSSVNTERFVHYIQDTGEIKSISSVQDYNLASVVVQFHQVQGILEGTDHIENYKIIFSPDEKDFVFIRKDDEEEVLQSIHDVIFQIPFKINTSHPTIYDPFNDITLIQDYVDTCWKIYMNGSLADSFRARRLYFDKEFNFYITEYNDPNILIKTITVPIKELVENYYCILPFDDIDYDGKKISIFTRKLFNKYQYIKTKL